MIICDAGPLIALAVAKDEHHSLCMETFKPLVDRRERLLVPPTVVAEVGHMIGKVGGDQATVALFLQSLASGDFETVNLIAEDWSRTAELVTQYAGFPLGLIDASVVAVAERLGATRIATVDQRHFRSIKPRHTDAFELIPYDLQPAP